MRHDPIHGPLPGRFAVIIEVKGSWNKHLMTEQRRQLAERYLPEAQTKTGIYLVGWYPLDLWTFETDYRRSRVSSLGQEQLLDDLNAQAASIQANLSVHTIPFLLDVPGRTATSAKRWVEHDGVPSAAGSRLTPLR